jgi:hypothetical protein
MSENGRSTIRWWVLARQERGAEAFAGVLVWATSRDDAEARVYTMLQCSAYLESYKVGVKKW